LLHHHRRQLLYAVLGSSRQLFTSYSVGPESSTALMTAAAVAALTSGNEQRYAETAAVLAIAVGAVCVSGWLARLGFWPTA
jgi:sulfate permease, SulP family